MTLSVALLFLISWREKDGLKFRYKRDLFTWISSMHRAEISRDNPTKVFDLIQKIGSGTYGDVYKVQYINIVVNWNENNYEIATI